MSDSKDLQKELGKLLKTYTEQVNSANAPVETPNMGEDRSNKEYKINFNLLPKELESYLREYVIGQEDSISTIATKICTHFHRMYYEQENPNEEPIVGNIKSNILLIGPTGVGKTYIIKLIADKIGVPFVKADATKFSETGYVGGDVEDLVRELVRKANGQVELAEYGIIYIDEIDKIASITSSHNPDISRSGVQRNLLKIMEESEVDIKNPFDISSQMEIIMEAQQKKNIQRKKINTKNILFIMSGAFNGIEELIGKRLNLRSVGFSQEKTSQDKKNITKDLLKHIKQDDLIEYGFESEFVGRLPVLSVLDTLTEDDFYKILKNPKSSVTMNKKRDFKSYGITLNFEDEALKLVSKLASGEKTGARSLVSLIEEKLVTFEKNLPSTEINELLVTKELIENPRLTLNKLLLKEDIDRIREDFKEHNINLSFDVEALTEIASQSQIENLTPYEYCTKVLKDYKYGLKLLEERNFEVTKDVIINHKEYLDSFIKSTYKSRKKL